MQRKIFWVSCVCVAAGRDHMNQTMFKISFLVFISILAAASGCMGNSTNLNEPSTVPEVSGVLEDSEKPKIDWTSLPYTPAVRRDDVRAQAIDVAKYEDLIIHESDYKGRIIHFEGEIGEIVKRDVVEGKPMSLYLIEPIVGGHKEDALVHGVCNGFDLEVGKTYEIWATYRKPLVNDILIDMLDAEPVNSSAGY